MTCGLTKERKARRAICVAMRSKGASYSEIAEALGVSKQAAAAILRRAEGRDTIPVFRTDTEAVSLAARGCKRLHDRIEEYWERERAKLRRVA